MDRIAKGSAGALLWGCCMFVAAADEPAAVGSLPSKEAKMFSRSAGYERYMGRWSRLLVPGYLDFAGVREGQHILDVGTGTGAVALAIETRTHKAEVVGIDPSEAFLAAARKDAASSRVRFEVGDAQALRFPDASFDQTLSLLVLNFVKDPSKAIAEMRRVTRPGGTVSSCVWDYNQGMQMARFFWDEAVALDPSMAAKDQRNMKFARQGELGDAWRKAGLTGVKEDALVIDQHYSNFDDYWLPFLGGAGAAGAFVASLTPERRQEIESRLRKRMLGDRPDGPFTLKGRAWCVRGEVS
ncbi:MAG TPA: methyltransferase domain-containing protein [Burkholderiales bacterium]|nr:methyltransferase domain-containing protein [Burkholderiales bacterium]